MIPFSWFLLQSSAFFTLAEGNVWDLVLIALLLDAGIAGIWYMVGALLSNQQVKATGKSEAFQVFGTGLIAVLCLTILLGFGQILNSLESNSNCYLPSLSPGAPAPPCQNLAVASLTPLSQQAIGNLCSTLSSANNNAQAGGLVAIAALLGGVPGSSTPVVLPPGICVITNTYLLQGDGTVGMDYPLAATGVITASELDQTATQINSIYVVDAYLSFLSKLAPNVGFCFQYPDDTSCYPPDPAAEAPPIYIELAFQPLAGLEMITDSIETLSTLLFTTLMSFTAQLMLIDLFLYLWPVMLFLGLVLRGTFFTRKIGGLLIAIVLGATLFYPALFAIEYTAGNTSPPAPQLQLSFCNNSSYQYSLNFYSLPSVQGIAGDCGCWPTYGLFGSEVLAYAVLGPGALGFWAVDIGSFLYNLITGLGKDLLTGNWNGVSSTVEGAIGGFFLDPSQFAQDLGDFGIPVCPIGTPTSGGEGMLFGFMQAFGITGVSAYFLPLLNILIVLAAVRGVSGVMGGDVNIAGISRFL